MAWEGREWQVRRAVTWEVTQIMAITGHKTFKEVQRYTSHVNQNKLAEQAMDKWEVANSGTKSKHSSG